MMPEGTNPANQSQLRRYQILSSFSATGLAVIISLGTSILLARALGPDGRGLLLALTFWPALLAGLLNLSLNEAAAFHVARRVGTSDLAAATTASAQLVVLNAVIATVVSAIALTFVVPVQYQDYLGLIVMYAIAFIPLSHGEQWLRGVLQGRGAILSLNALRLIQPVFYIGMLFALSESGMLDVSSAMVIAVAALSVSLIAGAIVVRPLLFHFRAGLHREIASTGWKFHKANLLLYAAAEADKIIVLLLLAITEVGLFAVAIALSALGTGVVLQSLGLMLMRDMASAEDESARRSVFVTNMRAAFIVLLLVNGVAAAATPWLIPLLFGQDFAAAVPAAVLLLGMGAFKGGRQMIDKALRATHHTRTGMIGEAISLVGIAILGLIGALTYGLEGVAIAGLLSQAIAMMVVLGLAKRKMSVTFVELWPLQKAALNDLVGFVSKVKISSATL